MALQSYSPSVSHHASAIDCLATGRPATIRSSPSMAFSGDERECETSRTLGITLSLIHISEPTRRS
eukprot:2786883-Prymnesium_polylepis.2